jgi:hypothetical protein
VSIRELVMRTLAGFLADRIESLPEKRAQVMPGVDAVATGVLLVGGWPRQESRSYRAGMESAQRWGRGSSMTWPKSQGPSAPWNIDAVVRDVSAYGGRAQSDRAGVVEDPPTIEARRVVDHE